MITYLDGERHGVTHRNRPLPSPVHQAPAWVNQASCDVIDDGGISAARRDPAGLSGTVVPIHPGKTNGAYQCRKGDIACIKDTRLDILTLKKPSGISLVSES